MTEPKDKPGCAAMMREGNFAWWCTRERDHVGQHEAHGISEGIFAAWPREKP